MFRRLPFGLCALLLAFGYQLWCVVQPMAFLHRHVLLMDDAFYYFQVARNLALTGVSTFDGIHRSSGIQPFWGLLLTGMAKWITDRELLVRAALLVSAALAFLTGLALRAWLRRLRSPAAGEWAGLLYATFLVALVPHLLGLEYPLHTLVVVLALAAWERALRAPATATLSQLALLGTLLTVNFWVRLDSAVFAVVAAAAVGWRLWQTHARRGCALLALGLPLALGVPIYAATCWLLAGTVTPISGLVKQHYARGHFAGWPWYVAVAGHGIWWLRVQARAVLDVVCSGLTEPLPWSHPALLATLATVLPTLAWRLRRLWHDRGTDPATRGQLRFFALVFAAAAVHVTVIDCTISQWTHLLQHYYAWLTLSWFAVAATLLEQARVPVAAALLVSALLWTGIGWRHHGPQDPADMHLRRAQVVEWLDRNLPDGARIGSWNAGQFGYTCRHTVVNLDGLVNDRAYLERLRRGDPVLDYLRQEGIRYVVDNEARDLIMPYRKTWDMTARFRDAIPWSAAELLFREEGQDNPLVVLRLK